MMNPEAVASTIATVIPAEGICQSMSTSCNTAKGPTRMRMVKPAKLVYRLMVVFPASPMNLLNSTKYKPVPTAAMNAATSPINASLVSLSSPDSAASCLMTSRDSASSPVAETVTSPKVDLRERLSILVLCRLLEELELLGVLHGLPRDPDDENEEGNDTQRTDEEQHYVGYAKRFLCRPRGDGCKILDPSSYVHVGDLLDQEAHQARAGVHPH
mmetsp:Transcript_20032/g.76739  ORF Transcript_20032/g.76739 Transcript_20032/m.76739 type:complete len:214 (-) Transcript_20032:676-1317(-)